MHLQSSTGKHGQADKLLVLDSDDVTIAEVVHFKRGKVFHN